MWHDNVSQVKVAKAITTSAVQHYQTALLQRVLTMFCLLTKAFSYHAVLLMCMPSFCSAITCGRKWPLALLQMQMSKQCCMLKHVLSMQRVSACSSILLPIGLAVMEHWHAQLYAFFFSGNLYRAFCVWNQAMQMHIDEQTCLSSAVRSYSTCVMRKCLLAWKHYHHSQQRKKVLCVWKFVW